MAEIPRLNGAIRALEQGQPAFVTFSPPEIGMAQSINAAPYDAVVFEMEHNPYDIQLLRDCMQYMLDRKQILKSGSIAPAVAPMVRIPPNGGEMNQFFAKQVLDMGVYGIVWPHVSTVEEARNAVAACRYPRPPSAPLYEPPVQPGDRRITRRRTVGLPPMRTTPAPMSWPSIQGRDPGRQPERGGQGDQEPAENLDPVPGIGYASSAKATCRRPRLPHAYEHPPVARSIVETSPSASARRGVRATPREREERRRSRGQGITQVMTQPTFPSGDSKRASGRRRA